MGNSRLIIAAVALAAWLPGCAAKKPAEPSVPRVGDVAFRALEASTGTYPAAIEGESYDPPMPFYENVSPLYPAELLPEKLPAVSVKVRLVVDESGNVTEVSPLEPTVTAAPFFAAVDAVARTWRFSPLVRFGAGSGHTIVRYHGQQQKYEGQATALPFHQDYEFTFTQRDGKGFVSTSQQ